MIVADKFIDHRIAVTESNIQPTPNPNNNTTKYEKINFNYRQSYFGNMSPKRTSGRATGISFGNNIRRFSDNMYIYIGQNKDNLIYIHL